jgi:hypothetical protein
MKKDLTPEEAAQGFHQGGTWHGKIKLCCNFCSWDTVEESRMPWHLETRHAFRPSSALVEVEVKRALTVPLYDANDELIQTVSEKRLI